jgi:hypothetical protein
MACPYKKPTPNRQSWAVLVGVGFFLFTLTIPASMKIKDSLKKDRVKVTLSKYSTTPESIMATVIEWPTFKIGEQIFTIKMNWEQAYAIADKFDWNIVTLFMDEQKTEQAMMKLIMDNEFTVSLLWYLIENKFQGDKAKLLEKLETAAALDPFREAVWASVVLFSSPQLREILVQSWGRLKKELKRFDLDSIISTNSSSESSQEAST